jgi:hypothetical protein
MSSRLAAPPTLGALPRSRSLSAMWLGRFASGRPRLSALTDLPTPSDSCNSTLPPSGRPGAMGMSWPIGSRWLQRGKPVSGSWVFPLDPLRLGGIFASASLTSLLLLGQRRRPCRSLGIPAVLHSPTCYFEWGLGGLGSAAKERFSPCEEEF